MRVALEKVAGVEKVNVTLKRGVAHIALKQGNTVTLPQLRQIIKDAGYSTRDAEVTATGTASRKGREVVLTIGGTDSVVQLAAGREAEPFNALSRSLGDGTQQLEVTGVVPAPASAGTSDRLLVQSSRRISP